MSDKAQALLDPLLQFYREHLDAQNSLILMLETEVNRLKANLKRGRERCHTLQGYVSELEAREDMLQNVIRSLVEHGTYIVRTEIEQELQFAIQDQDNDAYLQDFYTELFPEESVSLLYPNEEEIDHDQFDYLFASDNEI